MKQPIRKIVAASAMLFAINVSAKDIIDTASSAGSFKTLVAAIEAAGLTETLRGKGPFTVFAPTDEAFNKLPPGTLDALLKDKDKLAKILTYHVVPGTLMARDVKAGDAPTANGKSLTVTAAAGRVRVDNANVTQTDIVA
ncbi:MAG: fasciclin domain-containing protein, partial [Usitatibacteraceae bacterium]